jgi:hypothetical protein
MGPSGRHDERRLYSSGKYILHPLSLQIATSPFLGQSFAKKRRAFESDVPDPTSSINRAFGYRPNR